VSKSRTQVNASLGRLLGWDRGGDRMSVSEPSVPEALAQSPAWVRLEDQLRWYDWKAMANQRRYRQIKVLQLLAAASVPVAAALSAAHWVIAALGGVILVLEGLQQLGQYHETWMNYRGTCERLKREKFLFLAGAGPYGRNKGERLLAMNVERLISQEHAHWETTQEEALRSEKEEEGGKEGH
jgi:Protein of unknown function (DUF4231)